MLLTQTRWHYVAPVSCLPDVSIKNYSWTRLGTDIDRSVGRSSGKVQISLLGILGLICVWQSQPSADWQEIQLSGSKKERKTIIISIISPSFVDHLCSWSNELCVLWHKFNRKYYNQAVLVHTTTKLLQQKDKKRKGKTKKDKENPKIKSTQTPRFKVL